MKDKKLNIADLYSVSNLLKQLLEQNILTHDEANLVMSRIVKENGFWNGMSYI